MEKHAVMPSSLAKALIKAGVRHFDSGGTTVGGIGGALTPQNQYTATAPNITTQNLTPQIATDQNRAGDVYNQQQSLAKTLLAQSQGQGPNPALATLNQQTGNNVANTAALMASARGASSNPGLIAREAAQTGAATQQNAVGQAATLQAEQELGQEGQLQNLYQNEAGNSLQEEGINQGALASQNSALTTGDLGAQEINASTAQNNANNAASTTGGIIGGIGSVLGLKFSDGGDVPKLADGGIAHYATPVDPRVVLNVNSTTAEGDALKAMGKAFKPAKGSEDPISDPTALMGTQASAADGAGGFAGLQGEMVPTALDAAPALLAAANGGTIPSDFRAGGNVPGKAKVKGDSPKNDVVPALLSPGEEVLPRSVTMAPDAPEKAKAFVEALRERKGSSTGFAKVLKAKATLKDRVERLEKLCGGGMAK